MVKAPTKPVERPIASQSRPSLNCKKKYVKKASRKQPLTLATKVPVYDQILVKKQRSAPPKKAKKPTLK